MGSSSSGWLCCLCRRALCGARPREAAARSARPRAAAPAPPRPSPAAPSAGTHPPPSSAPRCRPARPSPGRRANAPLPPPRPRGRGSNSPGPGPARGRGPGCCPRLGRAAKDRAVSAGKPTSSLSWADVVPAPRRDGPRCPLAQEPPSAGPRAVPSVGALPARPKPAGGAGGSPALPQAPSPPPPTALSPPGLPSQARYCSMGTPSVGSSSSSTTISGEGELCASGTTVKVGTLQGERAAPEVGQRWGAPTWGAAVLGYADTGQDQAGPSTRTAPRTRDGAQRGGDHSPAPGCPSRGHEVGVGGCGLTSWCPGSAPPV